MTAVVQKVPIEEPRRWSKSQRIVVGYLIIGATANIAAVLGQVLGWW